MKSEKHSDSQPLSTRVGSPPAAQPAAELTGSHWVDTVHSAGMAWLILLISLVMTVIAWYLSSSYADQRAFERFNFKVESANEAITKRMLEYEQMLHSGIGFFEAVGSVDREQWRVFVSRLKIDAYFPGVQGVGYAAWITPEQKAIHEATVREQGFPEYAIRPAGSRESYTSIVYLEPFDWRNQRAFGFDMFSEPTRREAMTRARDTGFPAMSGKVTLVQETTSGVQFGFLMYLPLYEGAPATVEERRTAVKGFVYSPFRMGDLMRGILGHGLPEVDFKIFDGAQPGADTLLFDSRIGAPDRSNQTPPRFDAVNALTFGGRTWTVQYSVNDAFESATTTKQPLAVAVVGVIIDVLLFGVIWSLSRLRHRAVRLAEEMVGRLNEAELQYKTISDTANEIIITTNSRGVITYCNRAGWEAFGWSPDELRRKSVGALISMDTGTTPLAVFNREGNLSRTLEVTGMRADGSRFPMELSYAHWWADGESFFTIIARDITERKKVDRMKSEFISTVSHELRTPLTSIKGSLRLVESGVAGAVSEQSQKLLQIASTNVDRLARLINDILDVEKIESGTLAFDFRQADVLELVKQAIEENKAFAKGCGVTFVLASSQRAQVRVDADRFLQVMTNLLGNAAKFSPRGECVDVDVSVRGRQVRVAVIDRGRGIPPEFGNRIFTKFAQADSSDTREKGGTGLGLSIVKSLVERFGGEVGYESEPGRGATFYFDLPLCRAVERADADQAEVV